MNWLQDNLFGRVLVYVCGGFLALAIIMAIVWSLPVSVDTTGLEADGSEVSDVIQPAREITSLNELQVINQKPLFNENRLPEVDVIVDDEAIEDTTIAVKDAPDVKLTGVIITPDMKIATLTPSGADVENVVAHEGQSLIGEFVGWKVGQVKPRTVVLRSNDGRELELELQVHDTPIKEPPKPVPAVAAAQDAAGQAVAPGQKAPPGGDDGQGLSRAEQIRQRIAERREELRLEQEARAEQQPGHTQQPGQAGSSEGTAAPRSAYQDAIRNMIRNKSKENDSNNKSGG